MNFSAEYRSIIELLIKCSIKHTIHDFQSGAIMVDIWHRNNFYVLQFEEDFIGFSEIDENVGFDTNPDEKFYKGDSLLNKLKQIFI
jgi:hypothetical protein